jgi:hypothetical protein
MMTIVIAGYGFLALTIVAAVILGARRPEPKFSATAVPDPMLFPKRNSAPVFRGLAATGDSIKGGTEVLAFDA